MNKDQILMFAFNRKPTTKGLICYFEFDDSGNLTLTPSGDMGEMDENILIKIVHNDTPEYPTEKELEKLLYDYVNEHGREVFKK